MRICIVSLNIVPYYRGDRTRAFGGAEVQADFIAGALSGAGHDVTMAVTDVQPGEMLPYPAINAFDSSAGIPGLRFLHPRWTGIMGALRDADADVYYQRNAGMVAGLIAMFCRQNARMFVYGAGSDADFDPDKVVVRNWRDRMLFYYGLKRCSGIVVQNEAQAAAARKRFDRPIRLIPNGVRPKGAGKASAGRTIVWIGALRAVKQPGVVIELARALPEQQFTIIGGVASGELQLDAEIRAAAEALPNVNILGRIPHDEVQEILATAMLLVNTSRVEGFPNAYLEAWSHGIPVVTFNDVDHIVRDSGAGVVCASRPEMVEAIRRIAHDQRVGEAMSERSRGLVRDRFSPEELGRQYTDFFESLRDGNS